MLRSLARLVRAAGFIAETFESPGALLRSDIPKAEACLIVDVNLPEMNGIELCHALSTLGCRLPAILITGRTDQKTNRLLHQATAVAILHKPFPAALLFEAISAALSRSSVGD